MSNPGDRLAAFFLKYADQEPASVKAQLFRDLAITLADSHTAAMFEELARDIENAALLQHKLSLHFNEASGPDQREPRPPEEDESGESDLPAKEDV